MPKSKHMKLSKWPIDVKSKQENTLLKGLKEPDDTRIRFKILVHVHFNIFIKVTVSNLHPKVSLKAKKKKNKI